MRRRQVTSTLHGPSCGAEPSGQMRQHPLLGRYFKSAHPAETHFWEVALDERTLPYLDERRLQGTAALPGSIALEIALAAASEAFAKR